MDEKKIAESGTGNNSTKVKTTITKSMTVHQENNVKYEEQNFVDTSKSVWNYSILYDDDIATYQAGTHYQLYKKMGFQHIATRKDYYPAMCGREDALVMQLML